MILILQIVSILCVIKRIAMLLKKYLKSDFENLIEYHKINNSFSITKKCCFKSKGFVKKVCMASKLLKFSSIYCMKHEMPCNKCNHH